MVDTSAGEGNAMVEETKTSTLWHQKLRQMSEKGMNILTSNGKIPKVKSIALGLGEPCVLKKRSHVLRWANFQRQKSGNLFI